MDPERPIVKENAPAIDPVCGMEVDPPDTAGRVMHEGHEYLFCSEHCVEAFRTDPEKYLHAGAPSEHGADAHSVHDTHQPVHSAGCRYTCPMHPEILKGGPGVCPKCGMALEAALPALGTEYTCPMHQEIVRDQPGSCPICGMALEPRMAAGSERPNPELIDMTRRFWVAAILAVPVLVLAMVPELFGVQILDPAARQWVQFALATPVVLWAGWPFFVRGAASIRSGNLNMFTLISLGVGIAYLYSVAATLVPGLFP